MYRPQSTGQHRGFHMSRGLLYLMVLGWMPTGCGIGMLVDGNVRNGSLMLLLGLALLALPFSALLARLKDTTGQVVVPSPAYADPDLRRRFRNTGRLVIGLSVPS